MAYVKWFVINSLFMAFFIFQEYIPPFLWNGGYFLIWVLTVLGFVFMLIAIVILAITNDKDLFESARAKYQETKKPNLYYQIDFIYDLVMLVILAGMGLYVYAVFYLLANASLILFRNMIKD